MPTSSGALPGALPPGTLLQGGNFAIEGVLGHGGFGITYAARDTGLQRATAIKEFFPQGATRQGTNVQPAPGQNAADFAGSKQEFLHEARILAHFGHPNIVDVYTVFEENNTAYMVMEYLRGSTLAQMMERGPFSEVDALSCIRQIGAALEEVHRAGMLHQDVKPDNVIVADNRAVLLDFGLTQKLEINPGLGTVRLSGQTRSGTAGYAPLEQYSRHAQTAAYTDVYALAATLFHLLTGHAPPEATDRALGRELPDVRDLNPQVSPFVAAALAQGLAMEPQNRPSSVRAFLDLLDAHHQTPAPQAPAPQPLPAPPQSAPTAPTSAPPAPRDQRNPTTGRRRPRFEPVPVQRLPRRGREPGPGLFILPGCSQVFGCVGGCFFFLIFLLFALLHWIGTFFNGFF